MRKFDFKNLTIESAEDEIYALQGSQYDKFNTWSSIKEIR